MVPYPWQRCVCSGAFACSFSHPQLPPASNASNIVDFIDQQSFYTKISQWRSESWKSYQGIYNRTRQERSKHPCQLIHTNLVGSISPTCFLGERLFFTFVAWKICLVIKVHSEYCHKCVTWKCTVYTLCFFCLIVRHTSINYHTHAKSDVFIIIDRNNLHGRWHSAYRDPHWDQEDRLAALSQDLRQSSQNPHQNRAPHRENSRRLLLRTTGQEGRTVVFFRIKNPRPKNTLSKYPAKPSPHTHNLYTPTSLT